MARGQLVVIVATRHLYLWLTPRCGWLLAAMRALWVPNWPSTAVTWGIAGQ
jgi:hypothetical protein